MSQALLVGFVLLIGYACVWDVRRGRVLYLDVTIAAPDSGVPDLDALTRCVAPCVSNAKVHRTLVDDSLLRVTFRVEYQGDGQILDVIEALRRPFPSATMSLRASPVLN